jgi:hypothetical protein
MQGGNAEFKKYLSFSAYQVLISALPLKKRKLLMNTLNTQP